MNYHYRKNYEIQYYRLCEELGVKPVITVSAWSDFTLLSEMNLLLASLGCVLFDNEELELDLI